MGERAGDPGEDPTLTSKYGVSYVKVLQSADKPDALRAAACCKHYTAYGVDHWNGADRFTFNSTRL